MSDNISSMTKIITVIEHLLNNTMFNCFIHSIICNVGIGLCFQGDFLIGIPCIYDAVRYIYTINSEAPKESNDNI